MVARKLIIKVLFNDFIDWKWRICIFNKIGFNGLYVIMKGVPIIANFKSSFERCWSSLLRLLMALRRSLLRIDKASLLETFGSLKIRNFGYTPSCLQLLRMLMTNFYLFFLDSSFLYFRKSLTVTFPYLRENFHIYVHIY